MFPFRTDSRRMFYLLPETNIYLKTQIKRQLSKMKKAILNKANFTSILQWCINNAKQRIYFLVETYPYRDIFQHLIQHISSIRMSCDRRRELSNE